MADNHKGAFEAALAAARAAAQKFRDEGKLPAEEKYVAPVAPQGSQQIVATGGQEYRDLGLSNAYRRHSRAITDGSETGNGGYGGGGGRFDSPSSMSRFAGPAIGRGGGSGGAAFNRPQREFGSDTFTKESYNNSFTKDDGIGPQGMPNPNRDRSPIRGGFDDFRGGRGRGGRGGFRGGRGGRDQGWGPVSGVSFRGKRGRDDEDGYDEQYDPDQEYKIFIGGLHKETTTESLQSYFEQYGKVKYCQVKLDPSTGVSRGFGFILYEDPASVDNVIKNLPHTVDGKRVDAKRQHFKSKDMDDKLFVGGIPSDFSDGQLAEFFGPHGMVDAVERPRDQNTGVAKGFAFITFKDPKVVEKIVGQRWMTLPNGARIECKKKQHQYQGKKNQNVYADATGTMYMDPNGQAYVGEDWQNFDWTKVDPSTAYNQQQAAATTMDPSSMMMGMPGMEGDMSGMMGGGEMSQEQMQQMMTQMSGGGAAPPPPPEL